MRWSTSMLLRSALVAAAFAVPCASSTSWAAGETVADNEAKNVAVIKVEVTTEGGKVIQHDGVVFEWGDEGNITLKYNEHTHEVALKVERLDDGKKIRLTVTYSKDGAAVVGPRIIDSQPKKREVLKGAAGQSVAVTVTPKKMKLDDNGNPVEPPQEDKPKEKPPEPPPPPKDEPPKKKPRKIDGPDGNDPLEGVK